MTRQIALVVDQNQSLIEDAARTGEDAGLRIVPMLSTDAALDYIWEQGGRADVILTELGTEADLAELRQLVDNWTHLRVLLIARQPHVAADLPDRIKLVSAPSSAGDIVTRLLAA